jgi:imidazolonepropionase-like amidohydrolase
MMRSLLVLLATTATLAVAQAPRRVILRDVTVIPGDTSAPKPRMDVIIRDSLIVAIEAMGRTTATPRDSVINGRGLFAMPGLIDSHVHITGGTVEEGKPMLRSALRGGVTSVLDIAGSLPVAAGLDSLVRLGKIPGPNIVYPALFAGPPFYTDARARLSAGGYTPGTAPWGKAISDSTNIAAAVAAAKKLGARYLKLYAALDSATIFRIMAEAKKQGMRTAAHATTFPAKPSDLSAAGVEILMHAPYLAWEGSPRSNDFGARTRGDFRGVPADSKVMDDLLTRMAKNGTALNPTFFVFEGGRDTLSAIRMQWSFEITRRALSKGVRIVSGTDGLFNERRDSLPGIHRELELLVYGANFTPLEAIRSVAENGAWATGLPKRGVLRAGMIADVLLLGADPTVDIRNTRAIRAVFQSGRAVVR